jgi:hypothetical protein
MAAMTSTVADRALRNARARDEALDNIVRIRKVDLDNVGHLE